MHTTTSRITRPLALLLAIGATLAGLAAGREGWAADTLRHESWNWSGTLEAGRTLEINGINGEIVAEPGTGDRVEIVADKWSRRHDPARVRIKVDEDSHGITVCAIYPGESSPCEGFHFGFQGKANDVQVDFHVRLPAGAAFKAHTVNGAVRTHGLTGPLEANTVNGECDLDRVGRGRVSTVNGSVHATVGRVDPSDHLAFSTVNGSITLALPASLDADFQGSSVNGALQSDFPAELTGRWGPKRLSATLGHGGAHVRASTVNGSIRLQRANAQ